MGGGPHVDMYCEIIGYKSQWLEVLPYRRNYPFKVPFSRNELSATDTVLVLVFSCNLLTIKIYNLIVFFNISGFMRLNTDILVFLLSP